MTIRESREAVTIITIMTIIGRLCFKEDLTSNDQVGTVALQNVKTRQGNLEHE